MTLLTDSLARGRAAVTGWSPDLTASVLMVASFAVFSAMAVMARDIGDHIPVIQMVFVRQLLAFAFMAPVYRRLWPAIRAPRGLLLHAARGVSAIGAMVCGLSAVILIPLADATAIQMAEALFATALAAIVLREPVGWRRWSAAAVGFAGVAIMLRPFSGGLDPDALVALLGALCGAFSMIFVRLGSEHDRTETVMFWQGIVVLALVTPVAAFFWVTPSLGDAVTLFVMSLIFTIGQWLFTAALRMGDTAALAPLHYLRLLMMAAIGWLLYAEIPTLATVAGAVLILCSATYTLRRNAITRRSRTPVPLITDPAAQP